MINSRSKSEYLFNLLMDLFQNILCYIFGLGNSLPLLKHNSVYNYITYYTLGVLKQNFDTDINIIINHICMQSVFHYARKADAFLWSKKINVIY